MTGRLQTKFSELDVLPTKVLKDFLNELLPSITKLINLSFAQGVFPKIWKKAIVISLLKKSGFELTFANYRPVSNLSFLSKLIEKSALYRLNQHVNENDHSSKEPICLQTVSLLPVGLTQAVFGFVDDHMVIIEFKPILVEHEMTAIHELQESAITINDWMNSKNLKIDSSKTQFILFGSRKQLNKCITNEILVCGDNIKRQNCIRY